jgi:hypothetical protein
MSQSKRTPGPWWYNGRSRAVYAGNVSVANCSRNAVGAPVGQLDGNCRLIAAAPALLDACKELQHAGLMGLIANHWGREKADHYIHLLRDVLALAEGTEPHSCP